MPQIEEIMYETYFLQERRHVFQRHFAAEHCAHEVFVHAGMQNFAQLDAPLEMLQGDALLPLAARHETVLLGGCERRSGRRIEAMLLVQLQQTLASGDVTRVRVPNGRRARRRRPDAADIHSETALRYFKIFAPLLQYQL